MRASLPFSSSAWTSRTRNSSSWSVRPEHTDVVEGGVEGRVDVAEMMGSSVHLHISALGRDVIIIVPTTEMQRGFAIGDKVSFSFKGSVAHVFSKETDKNLEF